MKRIKRLIKKLGVKKSLYLIKVVLEKPYK